MTVFRRNRTKNHTLLDMDGTYQYGLYEGVPSAYWMRPKILRYYVKKSADQRRMPNNNSLQIGIILHSIRKLKLIIVLLLIQNISILNKHISSWTFFKTLSYFLARLRLKQTFFLEDNPYSKKQIIYVLLILAFLPSVLVRNSALSSSDIREQW